MNTDLKKAAEELYANLTDSMVFRLGGVDSVFMEKLDSVLKNDEEGIMVNHFPVEDDFWFSRSYYQEEKEVPLMLAVMDSALLNAETKKEAALCILDHPKVDIFKITPDKIPEKRKTLIQAVYDSLWPEMDEVDILPVLEKMVKKGASVQESFPNKYPLVDYIHNPKVVDHLKNLENQVRAMKKIGKQEDSKSQEM